MTQEGASDKNDGYIKKMLKFVSGCDWCERCCDCCLPQTPNVKVTKQDIQYVTVRRPISKSLSEDSNDEDSTGSLGSLRERVGIELEREREKERERDKFRTESVSSSKSRHDSSSSGYGSEYSVPRRSSVTPVIEMKPIEFWAARENVQPRSPRTKMPSTSEFMESFNKDLYEVVENQSEESLTDEEKLTRFQLGQIRFSLQYEIPTNTLMVKLIEAKELPPPYFLDESKIDMARSNPYCKICLLPDTKNSQQSSVQRKTQNPVWEEVFSFEIPYKELQNRTLQILLKDFDKYSRHCIVGQMQLPLCNTNLVKGLHMWKPLVPGPKEHLELGEILISLTYLPSAGRLNVDIIKAKQLIQTDLVGGSDPFVKISLLHYDKLIKTKKTTVKKNTIDPVFNESFSFNVTPQQLENTNLVVSVWDYNSKSKDDFVGRVVIGKHASGPEQVMHWNRMIQSHRSTVASWHALKTREECDQLAPASIAVP
ncbi:synaptotagmin-17 [Lingula anatina]|uniref:Synaptotagmin-17 n=1 Tax=Lingula anatina TaxID=7574 RepID=A0A1S3JQG0_LINAN|nr:synaptotagmin-17 [Lingula anatina]XP_013412205.1 synaptotagmin-17 [Lingula anatina]|eukprot:XP_013412204.1 synaptotagmin-17 [Lingula anatina]